MEVAIGQGALVVVVARQVFPVEHGRMARKGCWSWRPSGCGSTGYLQKTGLVKGKIDPSTCGKPLVTHSQIKS